MAAEIDWIMSGPEWLKYRCLLDLMDLPLQDQQVVSAYAHMADDPQIQQLIMDVGAWEQSLLKRHNDASHPIHKLAFLAELGLRPDQPGIQQIRAVLKQHASYENHFQVLSNYPLHFGGSGRDDWLWALCDTPLVAFSLLKMEAVSAELISHAYQPLIDLVRDNGWPCAVSPEIPRFRGPGRKQDPCPYATLLMLKLLALLDHTRHANAIQQGVSALLMLWQDSHTKHPYLFKMGDDFRKLKVPFVWYDVLHTAEVLSQFPIALGDPRFADILDVIQSKADADGRFTSESIWTKWKQWEFCQKKEPSRWVTLCVLRIMKRAARWRFNQQPAERPAR